LVRPDFDAIGKYHPVKPLDLLATEIGVPVEKLIKLDANENLYGVIPEGEEISWKFLISSSGAAIAWRFAYLS
jgi:histidinol-phosphate/aromatic aminotransferase/cobyric acid decarboxylase-like protein